MENLRFLLLIAGILSVLGILFGVLGRRMMHHMRQNRTLWVDAEEKKRAIQNERMRAIYELTSTLSSTLSYQTRTRLRAGYERGGT